MFLPPPSDPTMLVRTDTGIAYSVQLHDQKLSIAPKFHLTPRGLGFEEMRWLPKHRGWLVLYNDGKRNYLQFDRPNGTPVWKRYVLADAPKMGINPQENTIALASFSQVDKIPWRGRKPGPERLVGKTGIYETDSVHFGWDVTVGAQGAIYYGYGDMVMEVATGGLMEWSPGPRPRHIVQYGSPDADDLIVSPDGRKMVMLNDPILVVDGIAPGLKRSVYRTKFFGPSWPTGMCFLGPNTFVVSCSDGRLARATFRRHDKVTFNALSGPHSSKVWSCAGVSKGKLWMASNPSGVMTLGCFHWTGDKVTFLGELNLGSQAWRLVNCTNFSR